MISHFIQQVQTLMEIQQVKLAEMENYNDKSKYYWLCTKKVSFVRMSLGHEYKIRQSLQKVTVDEQIEILRRLIKLIDANPDMDFLKIPDLALDLINSAVTTNLVNETNLSRMSSFRKSLRRISMISNRITPDVHEVRTRCVTFQEQPIIYQIYK